MISGLDYILQLEQECDKQREYVKEEKEKRKELQQRIDKAIEYCKREIENIIANFDYADTKDLENILEILGDKENE